MKQPLQQRHQGGVGGGIIDRRAHHKTVGIPEFFRDFIDDVVKHTFAIFPAAAAGNTAPDGEISYMDEFRLDSLLMENRLHFVQGGIGRTILVGTAVQN